MCCTIWNIFTLFLFFVKTKTKTKTKLLIIVQHNARSESCNHHHWRHTHNHLHFFPALDNICPIFFFNDCIVTKVITISNQYKSLSFLKARPMVESQYDLSTISTQTLKHPTLCNNLSELKWTIRDQENLSETSWSLDNYPNHLSRCTWKPNNVKQLLRTQMEYKRSRE